MLNAIGKHPHIVIMIGAHIDALRVPTLILDFCDGGSIMDVLEARGEELRVRTWRPPKNISYEWCIQLLSAVDFPKPRNSTGSTDTSSISRGAAPTPAQPLQVHSKALPRQIHRDIKPANLLGSLDMKIVKLADFGLCRLVHPAREERDNRCM